MKRKGIFRMLFSFTEVAVIVSKLIFKLLNTNTKRKWEWIFPWIFRLPDQNGKNTKSCYFSD